MTPGSGVFDNGGTVQFAVDGTNVGTPANLTNGSATFTDSALNAGTHTLTAIYSGDTNFTGGTSQSMIQSVTQATTTSLVVSANPMSYGQTVWFTATVVPASTIVPTGTITWNFANNATTTTTLSQGTPDQCLFSLYANTVGPCTVTAIYGGDSNSLASTSATIVETINQAATTTTLTSSPNPLYLGQTVTFTATVASAASTFDNGGTVQFAVDGTTFGTPAAISAGKATITDSALTPGKHTITAVYNGDTGFATSSGALSGGQTVIQASTTTAVSSSPNPLNLGQTVTFTAKVTAGSGTFDNGGTMQFSVDGSTFGARSL